MLLHKFDFDYNAKDLQDLIRGFSVQILHQPILFSTASLHNIVQNLVLHGISRKYFHLFSANHRNCFLSNYLGAIL